MGSVRGEADGAPSRYSSGWRAKEQDSKPGRSGRIIAQKFQPIRDQCLKEGKLYEDPDFPAHDRSVFYSYTPSQPFEWKRPKEICPDAEMVVGGASRFDIMQGDLGNCWFLAAVASLCASSNKPGNQELLTNVIPKDNSFKEKYAGVVHFNIWQGGKWLDVVIDDKLPTLGGKLVFMHSAQNNEFWSALLEKAYAKLNGSYEALRGGNTSEAMEDFTGGVVECYNTAKNLPPNLYEIMLKANDRSSLMGCTIDAQPGQIESVLPNGLVMGHAYSVTGITKLKAAGKEFKLLRVRNPWGNEYEWKGAWGDSSDDWKQVSEADKKKCGAEKGNDGEFWMNVDDYLAHFNKTEICNLGPGSLSEEANKQRKKKWECTQEEGSWIKRVNAGGCRNFLDTFWTNPQYRIQVVDPDDEDDENTGTLLVALLQRERRKKKSQGIGFLTMGYQIYKLEDPNSGPLDLNFFKYNAATAKSPTFSNMREICGRHKLPPGHYVIIPSTFKANEEGDFLLRIFTEKPAVSSEIDEETGVIDEETSEEFLRQYQDQTDISPEINMKKSQQAFAAPPTAAAQQQAKKPLEPHRRRQRARQVTENDVKQERQVRELFKKVSGEDLEVDAFELRTILNQTFLQEFKFDGFSLETCRSLVAMKDVDQSGKLGYDEFKQLWNDMRAWKKIFQEFDADKSGTLCSYELRAALNSAGFKVSNSTFNCLVMRYSDQEGKIFFNCYIICIARLKTMFEIFKEMSKEKVAAFKMDQFIQTTMYT